MVLTSEDLPRPEPEVLIAQLVQEQLQQGGVNRQFFREHEVHGVRSHGEDLSVDERSQLIVKQSGVAGSIHHVWIETKNIQSHDIWEPWSQRSTGSFSLSHRLAP